MVPSFRQVATSCAHKFFGSFWFQQLNKSVLISGLRCYKCLGFTICQVQSELAGQLPVCLLQQQTWNTLTLQQQGKVKSTTTKPQDGSVQGY